MENQIKLGLEDSFRDQFFVLYTKITSLLEDVLLGNVATKAQIFLWKKCFLIVQALLSCRCSNEA